MQRQLKLPGIATFDILQKGTRTSSIPSRNSPHRDSHQLLWSSSQRQTRSCGWQCPTKCVPPCQLMRISQWTGPLRSSCLHHRWRCSYSFDLPALFRSASIGRDLPRASRGKSPAKSKGRGKLQPNFPALLQGKGLKGRNDRGELLCWNYNMERP